MPGDHALLSPSGAERWLACPPSARLEELVPDQSSEAADEGTLAHKLSEAILRYKIGKLTKREYNEITAEVFADDLYENAMFEYCDNYATYILELLATYAADNPDAALFVEQLLDLTRWIEEGFGTSDAVIASRKVLHVNDLKYGRGVPVYAENNKQMKVYALGAYEKFGFMYDEIETVRMSIWQPRIDNFSTFEMPLADLLKWADEELAPGAALAYTGNGDFKAGKHCGFCRVRATCRANAEFNLEIGRHEFRQVIFLTDEEISEILDRAAMFDKWIGSVQDHALYEAVHNSKKWPYYKLVEGRSNRVFTDKNAVASKLLEAGITEDRIYKPKELFGISLLENELGRDVVYSNLKELIIKPPGKLALVHVLDNRPEYNSLDAAKRDFGDVSELLLDDLG